MSHFYRAGAGVVFFQNRSSNRVKSHTQRASTPRAGEQNEERGQTTARVKRKEAKPAGRERKEERLKSSNAVL
jgi:hypothetical protein